jgi:hypothetical protein
MVPPVLAARLAEKPAPLLDGDVPDAVVVTEAAAQPATASAQQAAAGTIQRLLMMAPCHRPSTLRRWSRGQHAMDGRPPWAITD